MRRKYGNRTYTRVKSNDQEEGDHLWKANGGVEDGQRVTDLVDGASVDGGGDVRQQQSRADQWAAGRSGGEEAAPADQETVGGASSSASRGKLSAHFTLYLRSWLTGARASPAGGLAWDGWWFPGSCGDLRATWKWQGQGARGGELMRTTRIWPAWKRSQHLVESVQ